MGLARQTPLALASALIWTTACDGGGGRTTGGASMGTGGASIGDPMNPDMPAYDCMTGGATETEGCDTDGNAAAASTTTAATTGSEQDECLSSEECDGGSCVAPTGEQAGDDRPGLSRGPFACEFICVAELDDSQWCSDDASCCSPQARCTDRGYCIIE